MLVILEAQRQAGDSLKNISASLIAEVLSPPPIAFPDYTYGAAWWMMELLVQIRQQFIVEPHSLTGLLNKTITGKGIKQCSYSQRKHSTFFFLQKTTFSLHFCVLLAESSHCDAKSGFNVFSPYSWAKGSSSYLQCFHRASKRGTAKMHCATTVIWELG